MVSNLEFGIWNLDCGLKMVEDWFADNALFVTSKIRNLKSKMLITPANGHRQALHRL